jgi:metal-sulfur cluster biosynthetic enzyme
VYHWKSFSRNIIAILFLALSRGIMGAIHHHVEAVMITEDMVRSALKNVYDPEIGLDIINLGLVYNVDVLEDGRKVDVDMTLTTPACPAGPQIVEQARREIMGLQDVYKDLEEVNINLVWTPFWNPSMMTDEARDELGFF